MLSDLDIKRSLVEFDNFNISLEETDTLMEFLAVRSTQTGTSIDKLKDSLVEGLSKESKLRIDNLGISASELNEELEKTPNFVEAVANIAKREIAEAGDILDDAANSQEKFNAAYDNFQLAIGKGLIAKASDAFYKFGTNILNAITPVKSLTEETRKERLELLTVESIIKDVNTTNEERIKLINELKQKYPTLLSDIDAETSSNEELTMALKAVNEQLINKIVLQENEDEIVKQNERTGNARLKLIKQEDNVRNRLVKLAEKEGVAIKENATLYEQGLDLLEKVGPARAGVLIDPIAKFSKELRDLKVIQDDVNRENQKSNDLLKSRQDLLARLNISEDVLGSTEAINENNDAISRNVKFLNELINKEKEKLELATNRTQAQAIQNRISLLQKEIETILGRNKASKNNFDDDTFNLEKQRLQFQIDSQQRLIDNDKNTISQRLAATVNFTDKSILLLQIERDRALKHAKGRADELTRINEAYSQDYDALIRKREDNIQAILQSSFEKTKARIEEENRLQEEKGNERINQAQERLRKDLENLTGPARLARIQAYEDEVTQIQFEAAKERLEKQIELAELELKNPLLNEEQKLELKRFITAAKNELSDTETEHAITNAESLAQVEQRLFEMQGDMISQASQNIADSLGLNSQNIEAFFDAFLTKAEATGDATIDKYNQVSQAISQIGVVGAIVGDVLSAVSEANIIRIDEDLAALEDYYDAQIDLASEDESQREALELEREEKRKKLEEKRKEEQVKAAKFRKAEAILGIGVNLAQTLIAINLAAAQLDAISLGTLGTAYRAFNIPFAIGLAGAQTAAVLAKPIPKYRYGTEDHPGGPAEVAEVRPEVIIEPGKKPYIQRRRATLNLAPHSKVIPSVEEFSNQLLSASIMASLVHEKENLSAYEALLAFQHYSGDMVDELKDIKRAIKQQKLGVNIRNEKYDIPHQLFRSQNIDWS